MTHVYARLWPIRYAADLLGVKPVHVRKLVRAGRLKGVSFGALQRRTRFVTKESVEKLLGHRLPYPFDNEGAVAAKGC